MMDICKECGKDLATNATVCPNCGRHLSSRSSRAWMIIFGMFGAFLLITIVGAMLNNQTTNSTPTRPAAVTGAAHSKSGEFSATSEGIYLGAAGSYLAGYQTTAKELAVTMAGANDGSSTLDDIREAFKKAKFVDGMGYQGDYLDKFHGSVIDRYESVPVRYRPLADKVAETHRLFQSAAKETLLYWDDQNVAHIESGQATLKRSMVVWKQAIDLETKLLADAAKEQQKAKKPS